uniref:Protein LURP-one-related 7 n=1 Tax=Ananas comosus var. bracteatus TaxID=296719 RepID=A0A6V7PDD2_ANACO|nr:unnamed protein product [Ananas comosus var. bracteatus]
MTTIMSTEQEPPILPVACGIPVDYEITKSPLAPLTGPDLTVHDASGNVVYKIDGGCCAASPSSSCGRSRTKSLCDAAGSPLVSFLLRNGEWQVFKGGSLELKDTIFTVRKASASASKVELDVYLRDGNIEDPKPSFRLKGNPFRRSCTIVRENTIVAQACLLYKLRKFVYWRHKFRLTVYPGNDHILVLAMLVTFFGDSRRAEIGNCICCIFGT